MIKTICWIAGHLIVTEQWKKWEIDRLNVYNNVPYFNSTKKVTEGQKFKKYGETCLLHCWRSTGPIHLKQKTKYSYDK
jgi:hypothetical protein